MKKIRMIAIVLAAVIMGLGLSSCEKDTIVKEKRLVKFSYFDKEMTFKYDSQGRLTELVDKPVSGEGMVQTCTCVWGENTVDIALLMKFSESGQEYVENATLNLNDGLVCEIVSSGAFISSTKFIYGASNRLSHYVGLLSNISFEWNDDKLIYLREDVITGSMNDMAYTYKSNIETKGYNPLFSLEMSGIYFFLAHPELTGISSQRLPDSSVRHDVIDESEYISTYDYAYEFDKDGYVTKITASYDVNGVEQTPNVYTMVWE